MSKRDADDPEQLYRKYQAHVIGCPVCSIAVARNLWMEGLEIEGLCAEGRIMWTRWEAAERAWFLEMLGPPNSGRSLWQ
ncbi:MAG: hypothetical protein ACP5VE_02375 [Chthonomonadales bacterium]